MSIRVDADGAPLNIEGEGLYDDPVFVCERCFEECGELFDVETCRQTHWSPREVERWCASCSGADREDYDPRDEPDEDALEERRRR